MLRCSPTLIATFACAALLAASPAAAQSAGQDAKTEAAEPATPVQVDEVRVARATREHPVIGRFIALRAGDVAAQTEGPVVDFLVRVGDRVHKGDVLAMIGAERLSLTAAQARARLEERRAALAEAEAQLAQARNELQRLRALRTSSAFSQARFDDAVQAVNRWDAAARAARAAITTAEAEARRAERDLADTAIRAPYDGVVTGRHTEVGAYIDIGDPVVSLVNDSDLEIEADVPAQWLSGINPGDTVTAVAHDAASPHRFPATVRAVVPHENPRTRTRSVRFVPDLPDGLRPAVDQAVTVLVPQGGPRSTPTVSKDAVISGPDGQRVFVVTDGRAEPRTVDLGPAIGDRFEVRAGLAPGDKVVVRGNERLRPGQPVSIGAGS